jgi:hypothetical protein
MVISSEPHPSPQVTRPPASANQRKRTTVDNTPASNRRIPGPDDTAISARLDAIEERLDEIIRRLDEMKSLLTMLDRVQPNRQSAAEDCPKIARH